MKLGVDSKRWGLFLGPFVFLVIGLFFRSDGLSPAAVGILASTAWIAIWWVLEVVPIAITALLPLVLFPLIGGMTLEATASAFGHKYIFLYIGGFILAIAIQKWGLHKRIALNIISRIGTRRSAIVWGVMLATAFLSMWISNTATCVMMLPIGLSLAAQLSDNPETPINEKGEFSKLLMIAIAYSASIGGLASLIGTPPNLIFAGVVQDLYGVEITFGQWMRIGLPISLLLLAVCGLYLMRFAFPFQMGNFQAGGDQINRLKESLGPMSYEEKAVLIVFAVTALAWISRSFVLQSWIPAMDDTIIALLSAIALFIIPSKKEKRALIRWEEAVSLPWGVLLLFGGGLAIAKGFKTSGLALWLGEQLTGIEVLPLILVLVLLIGCINFLTEITSNLATTAMILPILAPLALRLDIHPFMVMVPCTLAASCAFMLPVATPPNAIVFGSGVLKIPDMLRTGIWMNMLSIFLILLLAYFVLPLAWDIAGESFPDLWK